MTHYCTQDPVQLEAMVAKVHQLEVQGGASGETIIQLAGHLLTVVSAYKSQEPRILRRSVRRARTRPHVAANLRS